MLNGTPTIRDVHTPALLDISVINNTIVQNIGKPGGTPCNNFDGVSMLSTTSLNNLTTPVVSDISDSDTTEGISKDTSILDTSPSLHSLITPVLSDISDIGIILVGNDTRETNICANDMDYQDVSTILKKNRTENVSNVIKGHLNINSIANKLDMIKEFLPGNIDVMIFTETKLNSSYPTSQLHIHSFLKPFRRDRN